ncbi:MAG TPA: ASCH domain-containing protein [Candidatus Dormibacteraeota bacterium]
MKALSFRQPFADAVVAGLKTVDFRGLSTRHRGPLAIHASNTYGQAERAAYEDLRKRRLRLPEPDPARRGALIGVVELTGCRPASAADRKRSLAELPEQGAFAYELSDARALPAPVPCKGHTYMFEVDDALLGDLLEAAV